LNVLTWGVYTDEELYSGFEEKTGCTINTEIISTNAALNSKLKAAPEGTYHVTKAGNWGGERAVNLGYYKPVDIEQIADVYDSIWDFTKLDKFERDGDIYGVPCNYWTMPLVYDEGDLGNIGGDDQSVSIDIMWDEEYENNLAGQDAARPQVFNAAIKLGIDPNDPDAILDRKEEVQEALTNHVSLAKSFWNTAADSIKMLKNDAVDISTDSWGGTYNSLNSQDFPAKQATFKEGTRAGVDNWHITKGTDELHERTIYEFIKYEMKERARRYWEISGLPVPVDTIDYTKDIENGKVSSFMIGEEAEKRNLKWMHAIDEQPRKEFNQMWSQAKLSG
jgi:spermidine/putrescine-binding protein